MNPIIHINQIPVFFIVGRGRSGSTLLRTLFDAHPGVCIPLESRFVQYLYYQYHSVSNWTEELVEKLLDDLNRGFEPISIDKENVHLLLNSIEGQLNFSTLCKCLYLSTHSEYTKSEIRLIGDKNPRYSFFIPQLLNIFPDARFIHLVRDYRDHLVSVKRSFKKIKDSKYTPVIISRWLLYNKQIEKQKLLYPERFYTLRFEDLISSPGLTTKEICKFLDLEYSPKMIEYSSNLHGYFGNENFSDLHKSLQTPFDKSKIGESETQLSCLQLLIAEAIAGCYGKKYRYSEKIHNRRIIKVCIRILFFPVVVLGALRFRLKVILYPYPRIMKFMHNLIR